MGGVSAAMHAGSCSSAGDAMRPPPGPEEPPDSGSPGGDSGSPEAWGIPPDFGVPPEVGGVPPEVGGAPYHERQRLELCALHALNNLLQRPLFTQRHADDICKRLSPGARFPRHRSLLGTGNYDVNVLMAALQGLGLAALWWDKRRSLERLAPSRLLGLILNVPSRVSLLSLPLPLRRRHWLALRKLRGTWYNLDSKLPAPAPIGGDAQLREFLRRFLAREPCELLLVVPRELEESGAWLDPE
ncbi:josephin-2 [Patagioenas fasciata]|uniref:josephin-2 n=1 Tax=Patagioenas fasciata TaxID=372321 RepID=UPI003A990BA1